MVRPHIRLPIWAQLLPPVSPPLAPVPAVARIPRLLFALLQRLQLVEQSPPCHRSSPTIQHRARRATSPLAID